MVTKLSIRDRIWIYFEFFMSAIGCFWYDQIDPRLMEFEVMSKEDEEIYKLFGHLGYTVEKYKNMITRWGFTR